MIIDKEDFTIHSLQQVHVVILHHKNSSITLGVYAYYIDEDKTKRDKEIEKI